MSTKKQEKTRLHTRNRNRKRYDLEALIKVKPELKAHVKPNKFGVDSIDFSNPLAVKLLNKALLHQNYNLEYWDFPDKNLCPPIPGRADYIHYIADLLAENNLGKIPTGDKITAFDLGVGASCIYPIIGVVEYGWQFIASDVDSTSITSAKNIVNSNSILKGNIDCRLQKDSRNFFNGIITQEDKIDVVVCNPPFHASLEEAQKGTRRKVKNLSGKKMKTPHLNFSGMSNELIYEGGEVKFIQNMIWESRKFAKNIYWFTTLVAKQAHLKAIFTLLKKVEAKEIKEIPMGTGNKSSRIVAWTFLSAAEQKKWVENR